MGSRPLKAAFLVPGVFYLDWMSGDAYMLKAAVVSSCSKGRLQRGGHLVQRVCSLELQGRQDLKGFMCRNL